jgi:sialate O-acetylesterase
MKWLFFRQACSANPIIPTGISPVDVGAIKDKGNLVNLIYKLFAVLVLSNPIQVFAEVKVSNIFSSDMIVQRDKPVNVWGTADNGEQVTVSINSQNISTTAENGKWKITLKPMKAGGPSDMKITGANTIVFKNILVGDIWLCGGQSNMDYDFGVYMKWRWDPIIARQYSKIAKESSANQSLRVVLIKKVSALPGAVDIPVEDDEVFRGKWQTCSKEVIPRMSAVGFVFAQRLQKLLNIPVGLIDANKGGSFIKFWEPPNSIKDRGELRPARNMYNAMIGSIKDFPIKGFIWYQGESDAINLDLASQYEEKFQLMIEGWRRDFSDPEMPFLFVQLAAYERNPYLHGITYPVLRDAQTAALSLPNTGMAVAIDLGDPRDIHPPKKILVSERLVLAARKIGYGEEIIYSGPIFKKMVIVGAVADLSFDHCGSGLIAKTIQLANRTLTADKLEGFEISDAEGRFFPAKAKIQGEKVEVSSAKVTTPVAVRYGYHGYPYANLYNKEGLPASPFRTDKFKIVFNKENADLYQRVLFLPRNFSGKKMTLEQRQIVATIHDKYLTKEKEINRRELWNAWTNSSRVYGRGSAEEKKAAKKYDDFMAPLYSAMEADIKAEAVFE